jgi:S-adenosyl-L-methionine hydrolase (adenosine-forming)
VTRPILFLSDLGLKDEFVGVCDSVITRIAPDARIADLFHGVSPMNVSLGAVLLADGPARGTRRPRVAPRAGGLS